MLKPQEMTEEVRLITEEMALGELNEMSQVICATVLEINSMPCCPLNRIESFGQLAEACQTINVILPSGELKRLGRAGLHVIPEAQVVSLSEPVRMPQVRAFSCVARACRNQSRLVQARHERCLKDEDGLLLYLDPQMKGRPRCRCCGGLLEELLPLRLMLGYQAMEVKVPCSWQPIVVLMREENVPPWLALGSKLTLHGIPQSSITAPQFGPLGPFLFLVLGVQLHNANVGLHVGTRHGFDAKLPRLPLSAHLKREKRRWKGWPGEGECATVLDLQPAWLVDRVGLRSRQQRAALAEAMRINPQVCLWVEGDEDGELLGQCDLILDEAMSREYLSLPHGHSANLPLACSKQLERAFAKLHRQTQLASEHAQLPLHRPRRLLESLIRLSQLFASQRHAEMVLREHVQAATRFLQASLCIRFNLPSLPGDPENDADEQVVFHSSSPPRSRRFNPLPSPSLTMD